MNSLFMRKDPVLCSCLNQRGKAEETNAELYVCTALCVCNFVLKEVIPVSYAFLHCVQNHA